MVETHGRLGIWKKRFINNLCRAFLTGGIRKLGKLPIALSACQIFPVPPPLEKWAMPLYRGAWYACYNGKIAR
jgi:hypothetical protein